MSVSRPLEIVVLNDRVTEEVAFLPSTPVRQRLGMREAILPSAGSMVRRSNRRTQTPDLHFGPKWRSAIWRWRLAAGWRQNSLISESPPQGQRPGIRPMPPQSASLAPARGGSECYGIGMVQLSGIEPPTSGSTIRRSNQLSYNCTSQNEGRKLWPGPRKSKAVLRAYDPLSSLAGRSPQAGRAPAAGILQHAEDGGLFGLCRRAGEPRTSR